MTRLASAMALATLQHALPDTKGARYASRRGYTVIFGHDPADAERVKREVSEVVHEDADGQFWTIIVPGDQAEAMLNLLFGDDEDGRDEAEAAMAKVRATLNEPANAAVIHYHSVSATHDWPAGSADEALQRVARRVARRIGPLLPDTAVLFTARLLVDLAGSHPEHLSPAEARHVKRRVGR